MINPKRSCALLAMHLLVLVAPATYAGEVLTQEQIRAMSASIEAAAQNHDAARIMDHFAPDAKIQFVMPASAGGKTVTLSTLEYDKALREGWSAASNSTYRVEGLAIDIAPDGQTARLTDTTIETTQINRRVLSSRTHETVSISLRGGRPVITEIVGRVQLRVVPAAPAGHAR